MPNKIEKESIRNKLSRIKEEKKIQDSQKKSGTCSDECKVRARKVPSDDRVYDTER